MSPKVMRAIHATLTWFWVALWIAAMIFGWLSSVEFVSHLSAIALVLGSWSSWQSTRVEVKQEEMT